MGDLITLKKVSTQKRYNELVLDLKSVIKQCNENKCQYDLLKLHNIYDIDTDDEKAMSDAIDIIRSLNKEYGKIINKMLKEKIL